MHKLAALLNAVVFFLCWLVVLYAGADHPPPPGFVTVVLLDLAAAALVYWRVPVYWTWTTARGSRALPLVVRDGLIAGLLFAAMALTGSWLLGSGESTLSRSAPAAAVWFAVVGNVGVVNAAGIYLVNWAVGWVVSHTMARL